MVYRHGTWLNADQILIGFWLNRCELAGSQTTRPFDNDAVVLNLVCSWTYMYLVYIYLIHGLSIPWGEVISGGVGCPAEYIPTALIPVHQRPVLHPHRAPTPVRNTNTYVSKVHNITSTYESTIKTLSHYLQSVPEIIEKWGGVVVQNGQQLIEHPLSAAVTQPRVHLEINATNVWPVEGGGVYTSQTVIAHVQLKHYNYI